MKLLDSIPLVPLIMISIFLALAPFQPEPHLLEKLKMLGAGTLVRPLDIFDLLMHISPLILLTLKLIRNQQIAAKSDKPSS